MKYIRTKDGIFEVVKEDGDWLEIVSNFVRKMQCHCVIKKHAVINQADTIEELCDAFIDTSEIDIPKCSISDTGGWLYDDYDSKNKCLIYTKEDMTRFIPLSEFDYTKIFGAIWTDKGLIYVAKMNEKGELELL